MAKITVLIDRKSCDKVSNAGPYNEASSCVLASVLDNLQTNQSNFETLFETEFVEAKDISDKIKQLGGAPAILFSSEEEKLPDNIHHVRLLGKHRLDPAALKKTIAVLSEAQENQTCLVVSDLDDTALSWEETDQEKKVVLIPEWIRFIKENVVGNKHGKFLQMTSRCKESMSEGDLYWDYESAPTSVFNAMRAIVQQFPTLFKSVKDSIVFTNGVPKWEVIAKRVEHMAEKDRPKYIILIDDQGCELNPDEGENQDVVRSLTKLVRMGIDLVPLRMQQPNELRDEFDIAVNGITQFVQDNQQKNRMEEEPDSCRCKACYLPSNRNGVFSGSKRFQSEYAFVGERDAKRRKKERIGCCAN